MFTIQTIFCAREEKIYNIFCSIISNNLILQVFLDICSNKTYISVNETVLPLKNALFNRQGMLRVQKIDAYKKDLLDQVIL